MIRIVVMILLVFSLSFLVNCGGFEILTWSDEFDDLNEGTWNHYVTAYPKDNFQYYRNNRKNSWVENGILHMMPTLTADEYGETFLYSGKLDLYKEDPSSPCNIHWAEESCYDEAGEDIVKPVQSVRMETRGRFSFKFGRVEIRAKLPLVAWMRPAMWLMSEHSVYGGFPKSGELDIMESSGNRDYVCGHTSRGVDWTQNNIHFGPSREQKWSHAVAKINTSTTYADAFHIWELIWTEKYVAYRVDGEETYRMTAPGGNGSLWDMAGFEGDNIYASGGPMAPFDQEFYLILSSAFGGWPFYSTCSPPAPWDKDSTHPRREFWEAKDSWIEDWTQPFQVDYIRLYQDIQFPDIHIF